jgi:sugar phosphate isomerase/epimerase
MDLRARIGVDLGGRLPLEQGLAWAASHRVHYVDVCLEAPGDAPNAPGRLTDDRIAAIRALCERHDIRLGLHTLSAVNVAESAPHVADGVEQYLQTYMDLAPRLGAGWIVVHAGYHFSSDYDARRTASVERLRRAADYASRVGTRLLLENLNREPDHAEIHYLAFSLEECRFYFREISPAHLGWAFTVNHAHLVPEGIDGFIDGLDLGRCGEVRLADSLGDRELHLPPGEGSIDFGAMFRRIEGSGYRSHYMMAFGSRDDMLRGRERLLGMAGREGRPD